MPETIYGERLIHRAATERTLHPSSLKGAGVSIYYGTGLTTRKAMSIGIPFDILILILVAEKTRRYLGGEVIYHHIADTHALTNTFCAPSDIAQLAVKYQEVVLRVSELVRAPIRPMLASKVDQEDKYLDILETIKTEKGVYVQRELADMLWYRTYCNVRLKLGWLISENATKAGFDERMFDQEFIRVCDGDFSFAYTVAGRTFDRERARVSPYISTPGELRLLLQKGERVYDKYHQGIESWNGDRTMGGAIEHLGNILRLWDELGGAPIPQDGEVLERVQYLIDLICT